MTARSRDPGTTCPQDGGSPARPPRGLPKPNMHSHPARSLLHGGYSSSTSSTELCAVPRHRRHSALGAERETELAALQDHLKRSLQPPIAVRYCSAHLWRQLVGTPPPAHTAVTMAFFTELSDFSIVGLWAEAVCSTHREGEKHAEENGHTDGLVSTVLPQKASRGRTARAPCVHTTG